VDLAAIDQAVVERYLQHDLHLRGGRVGSRRQKEQWLFAEVQQFLRGGHILLRGVPAADEVKAVRKICEFLQDHGQTLNFSCASWKAVIVVLSGADEGEGDGEGDPPADSSRRKRRNLAECYSVTLVGGGKHAVLEVPWDFRGTLLMAALGDLPHARDPAFASMRG
jgi:hypothetical protein